MLCLAFTLLHLIRYALSDESSQIIALNEAIIQDLSVRALPAKRDPVSDCVTAIPSPECWEVLNVSNWLQEWYNTTPSCQPRSLATANCRSLNETWTDTFLRMAENVTGGLSCVELDQCLENPPTSKDIRIDVDSVDAARYFYVIYNIYGNPSFIVSPHF